MSLEKFEVQSWTNLEKWHYWVKNNVKNLCSEGAEFKRFVVDKRTEKQFKILKERRIGEK